MKSAIYMNSKLLSYENYIVDFQIIKINKENKN